MLATSLDLNLYLQKNRLSHNRLSLLDVSNLMTCVKESTIWILHLEVSGISDEGGQNIASNLNTGLAEIHLAGNVFPETYPARSTFCNRFEFTHNWNSCTLEKIMHVKLRSLTMLVSTKAEIFEAE